MSSPKLYQVLRRKLRNQGRLLSERRRLIGHHRGIRWRDLHSRDFDCGGRGLYRLRTVCTAGDRFEVVCTGAVLLSEEVPQEAEDAHAVCCRFGGWISAAGGREERMYIRMIFCQFRFLHSFKYYIPNGRSTPPEFLIQKRIYSQEYRLKRCAIKDTNQISSSRQRQLPHAERVARNHGRGRCCQGRNRCYAYVGERPYRETRAESEQGAVHQWHRRSLRWQTRWRGNSGNRRSAGFSWVPKRPAWRSLHQAWRKLGRRDESEVKAAQNAGYVVFHSQHSHFLWLLSRHHPLLLGGYRGQVETGFGYEKAVEKHPELDLLGILRRDLVGSNIPGWVDWRKRVCGLHREIWGVPIGRLFDRRLRKCRRRLVCHKIEEGETVYRRYNIMTFQVLGSTLYSIRCNIHEI